MKVLRIGVVGAGAMRGQTWIATATRLPDQYELVGICEAVEARAQETAERWHVPVFRRLDDMLQTAQPDVVFGATPPDANHVIAQLAAQQGAHVITEIPVAPARPIAEATQAVCREHHVLYEVAENVYRWPQERLMLAHLTYVSGSYHGFNAVRTLLGSEARRIMGYTGQVKLPIYDDYMLWQLDEQSWDSAVIEFENGVGCVFHKPPQGLYGNTWEFEATQGNLLQDAVQIGKKPDSPILPFKAEYTAVDGAEVLDHLRVDLPSPIVWENPYKKYGIGRRDDLDEVARAEILTQFRNSIVEGRPPQYGAASAWRDQELVVALAESARRDNRWIDLPLKELTQVESAMLDGYKSLYGHGWDDIAGLAQSPLPRGGVRWAVLRDL
jgi:predicted dehydrogenase